MGKPSVFELQAGFLPEEIFKFIEDHRECGRRDKERESKGERQMQKQTYTTTDTERHRQRERKRWKEKTGRDKKS